MSITLSVGLALGYSVTKAWIESAGGWLVAASMSEQPTTEFRFDLPPQID